MNKNEQDMIRKIKEKSEQVPVPKALEPRQIEAKLAGKKKKVWTPARIGGLAAACLVLIVGVMVYQNYFKMEDATRDDKIACSDVTISDSTKVESAVRGHGSFRLYETDQSGKGSAAGGKAAAPDAG